MTSFVKSPKTVLDCINAYHDCFPKDFSSIIKCSIIKYTLPGIGLDFAKGRNLSKPELEKAYALMQKLPISKLKEFLDSQAKVFEKLNLNTLSKNHYRWGLNKFLKWVEEQGWVEIRPKETEVPEFQPYRFRGEPSEKIKRTRLTDRTKTEKFSLSFETNDYPLPIFAAIALLRIQAQLQEFENFQKNSGFNSTTIELRRADAEKLLGWLYKAEGISIEELSFSCLVEVVPIKIDAMDFNDYDEFMYAQYLAEENNLKIAEECFKRIARFFKWLPNPPHPRTKQRYIESVITIAKFLYRNQTDSAEVSDYSDIPVINRLRIFCSDCTQELKLNPSAIAYDKKAVTWETAFIVLEKLRFEALVNHIDKKSKRTRSGYVQRPRSLKAIANSFMRFLLLAMFVLIPPDRQQSYRTLRFGETLKHGLYQENFFIPFDKMSNTAQAKYYIYLLPEDYKTGKFYGEWLGTIPNSQFKDGTTFYQYLDLWLYGARDDNPLSKILNLKDNKPLRDALKPKEHNYVFLGRNTGLPMNRKTLASVIQSAFEYVTGVPVCPHTLRNMFRTYIDEIGISDEESRSVAFWMKHDTSTAKQYSRQNCASKLKAGSELSEKINRNILEKINLDTIKDLLDKDSTDF